MRNPNLLTNRTPRRQALATNQQLETSKPSTPACGIRPAPCTSAAPTRPAKPKSPRNRAKCRNWSSDLPTTHGPRRAGDPGTVSYAWPPLRAPVSVRPPRPPRPPLHTAAPLPAVHHTVPGSNAPCVPSSGIPFGAEASPNQAEQFAECRCECWCWRDHGHRKT